MPRMTGSELIEEIIKQNISIKKIIILSAREKNELIIENLLRKHPNIKFINKKTTTQQLLPLHHIRR